MDALDLLGNFYVTFLFLAMCGIGTSELWNNAKGRPSHNVVPDSSQPILYRVLRAVMGLSGLVFFGLLSASVWGIGPERTPLLPASIGIALTCLVLGSFVKRRR